MQQCRADRCAVDVPHQKPAAPDGGGVDEASPRGVVAGVAERLAEKALHPVGQEGAIGLVGPSRRSGNAGRRLQGPQSVEPLFERDGAGMPAVRLPGVGDCDGDLTEPAHPGQIGSPLEETAGDDVGAIYRNTVAHQRV